MTAVIGVLAGCATGGASGAGAGGSGPSRAAVPADATTSDPGTTAGADAPYPDVVDVELTPAGDAWDVAVTISSPYDTPQRYADGWRVMTLDGEVLGTHDLAHDHAGEQPFTRVQRGLAVPPDVDRVVIEGRDLVNGYGGTTMTVDIPR